jgi:hypothetical protein
MKFFQINLHYSKAVTAVLGQQLTGMVDVALIQEPWICEGQIRVLTSSEGTIFFCCSWW